MTDNVVSFPKQDDRHTVGPAKCLDCGTAWQAVAPVGTAILQCPVCLTDRGVRCGPILPDDGEVWTCHCGCWAFCHSKEQAEWICLGCGCYQRF